MKWVNKIAAVLILGGFMSGCGSSTYITSTWRAPNAQPREYQKLLVLGIMGDRYLSYRAEMETALVQDLESRGVNAVSAYVDYGPKAFQNMDQQQMTEKIKNKGFDGVITIALLSKERERYYVPGNVYYTPFGWDYPYFWGYYSAIYGRVWEPGYYEEGTNYFWESNLYDLNSPKGKLVYSVQSKSFDPVSAQAVGIDYGKLIVRDLINNGLIIGKNSSASR